MHNLTDNWYIERLEDGNVRLVELDGETVLREKIFTAGQWSAVVAVIGV
jgi:hypothetical protein